METKFEVLEAMVNELNSYNGALEHLACYPIEDIEEYLGGMSVLSLIQKIQYGDFNINDDYFRFNGYANLESLTEYEYEQELIDYEEEIVEQARELGLDDLLEEWEELAQED